MTPDQTAAPEPAAGDLNYVSRLRTLIGANFNAELTKAGVEGLIADRGHDFARMPDSQVIMMVAGSLGAPGNRVKYGTGRELPPGDKRLRGGSDVTITVTRPAAPKILTTAPMVPRDGAGRFAPEPAKPPSRPSSF